MQEIIIYDLIGDHVTAIYKETIQGINSTAAFVQRFNTRIVIRELKQCSTTAMAIRMALKK